MKIKKGLLKIFVIFLVSCAFIYSAHAAESARMTPIVKVVKDWAPSVVNISTENTVLLRTNPNWGNYGGFFDDFFSQTPQQTIGTMRLKNVGSGVIISKDGLIMTNAHVVNMASSIFVIFNNETRVEAKIAAVSPANDLALLKIEPPFKLKPVNIASDMMLGETVIAVGNSLGLENSVSAGIISGFNREFANPSINYAIGGLIQTDAPINPGNSGGALFNLDGALVGINLAVVQNAQSVGFAIPCTKIKEILKEYEEMSKENKTAAN